MQSYDGAEVIERAWREGLKPDPLLTVSQCSDQYRVLSQRVSSEPGPMMAVAPTVEGSGQPGLTMPLAALSAGRDA
jgi:phage terminase large subunit GpA-like protein